MLKTKLNLIENWLLMYVIYVIFEDFFAKLTPFIRFLRLFLFFSLKIINVKCNLLIFSIIFCIIVPCLPFFEIIFYFFI